MATNEEVAVKGNTSTEAYEETMEARSGACAPDYWAGPGVNRPALDGKGVSELKTAKKSKPSTKKGLEKRLLKLERALQEKGSNESRKKKPVKSKYFFYIFLLIKPIP